MASRHGISRLQLYRWRQLFREGDLGGRRIEGFVPAVVVPEMPPWIRTPYRRPA
ncbi:hypothetical protein NKH72_28420 [Mesorhizobium sp. M0955]|uniref:hypothetical protein n=1 Tax=Mesorhizobium sp. M0955 TaxID=2957033 RepID=UPI00333C7EB1